MGDVVDQSVVLAAGCVDPAVDAAPSPRRMLSAAEVGAKIAPTRTGRAVRRWTEASGAGGSEPCPHDRVTRGKEEVILFNLDEVLAWTRRHGLEFVKAEDAAPMFTLGGAVVEKAGGTGGQGDKGTGREGEDMGRKTRGTEPGHGQDARATEPDPLAGVPVGEERVACRETLADLRRQVEAVRIALRAGNVAGLSASQIKSLMDSAAKASFEIRQIDDQDLKSAKARGELVDRRWATEAIGELSSDFVNSLTRMEVELGAAVKMSLAEHGCLTPEAAGEGERVERLVRAVVRIAADRERSKLSQALNVAASAKEAA